METGEFSLLVSTEWKKCTFLFEIPANGLPCNEIFIEIASLALYSC